MNKPVRLVLTVLLWFVACTTHGQEFPMLHFAINNGLPSNNVYQVFRDSKGYLWIATDKGIARYNGIRFETFTTFDGLADNEIFFFEEDHFGRIWLGTFNGELCYYQNDSFHTAQNTPFLKLPFKSPHTYCMIIEQDSSVTVNYYDKRILVNIKNNKCSTYRVDCINDRIDGNIIYNRKLSDNQYEVSLRRIDPIFDSTSISKDIIIDTLCNIKKSTRNSLSFASKIALSQNETFFIDDRFVYSDNKKILRQLKDGFARQHFIYSYYDDSSNYFFATKDGLFINDTIHVFKDDNVSSITKDNNGNYWVGTLNDGIYCIRNGFMNTTVLKDAYRGKVIYCYADTSHIFFTTSDNNLFSLERGKTHVVFDYGKYRKTVNPNINDGVYLVDKGNYYSLYSRDLIVVHNIGSAQAAVDKYKNYAYWINLKSVLSAGGYIYQQGRDKIYRSPLSDLGDSIVETVTVPTSEDRVFAMAKSPDNNIWYSTINKVCKVENGHGIPQPQFKNEAFKLFGFYGQYLVGYTHLNQLLICSNVDGNIRIDSIPPQNCIWDKLYRLDADHILISTDNLYRVLTLQPGNTGERFSMFVIEDPFIPLHSEDICADSSKCYFFNNGSVISIDIKSLLIKPASPKIFFTLLKTRGNVYTINNELSIPFDEAKNMLVQFSTLSASGKNIFYQYSVSKDNIDHWSDIAGENINLFDPGYGDYVVKVRAKSISSDYCVPEVFRLHISKPFWAKWWFIALLILAIGAVIGITIRRRIIYVLRKNKRAHETEIKFMKSEYKALNALMNPHFIFNTLNNVQSLVNENDKESANTYLRIFADLIRQNMHNVSKELITLQKEIELVTNYLLLEKLRFEDKLNYTINIDRGLDLSEILVPPLLIQPLVENSIKHGIFSLNSLEGKIHINIYRRNDVLYIEIKDNGVGMGQPKNTSDIMHESFGLANIKKRIQQLSIIQNKEMGFSITDITDGSGKVMGTIAIITIPVTE